MTIAGQDTDGGAVEAPAFGKYRLHRLVGRGGFASVYLAELQGDYGFRKSVALKVLRRQLESLHDLVSAEFLNEARLGASIRHPNLVEFYECGRVGNRLYIAMELVEGPNLAQVLQYREMLPRPLSRDAILSIATQIAIGLRALHGASIDGRPIRPIHQDMKPGNLLLPPDGTVKISDYGIARFATDFYETLGLEGPRGSPLYMSPEQAAGEELCQATDVFSFATMMTELVTGGNPFSASTIAGVMNRVMTADTGETLDAVAEFHPELAAVLEICLRQEPERRYKDGAALAAAMEPMIPDGTPESHLGEVVQEMNGILAEQNKMLHSRPVQVFWGDLEDDPDQTEAVNITHAEGGRVSHRSASMPAVQAVQPPPPRRWWLPLAAVPIAGVLMAVGWFGATTLGARVPSGEGEEADSSALAGGGALAPRGPVDAAPAGSDEPPFGPTWEELTAEPEPSPSAGDLRRYGLVPPVIQHEPVSRGIRGKDTPITVGVQPSGAYQFSLWYRSVPDGDWQRADVHGGQSGQVELTLTMGDWLTQQTTAVEYFIDVEGPGGSAKSGSAAEPHQYKLY